MTRRKQTSTEQLLLCFEAVTQLSYFCSQLRRHPLAACQLSEIFTFAPDCFANCNISGLQS